MNTAANTRRRSRTHRRFRRSRCAAQRRGLSLLETILAIAILGGSIAAIGEAVRVGTLAATDAREMTMAQLLCEGKMAEVSSGLQPLMASTGVPVEVAPDWLYTIELQQLSGQSGLLGVAVTVYRDPQLNPRPVSVTLFRWMVDPELAAQLEEQAAMMQQTESGSSSSSSSSGSTGGTGNG